MTAPAPRKFTVRLACSGDMSDHAPLNVLLGAIATRRQDQARYQHLEALPIHPAREITGSEDPDCWLQLWELDTYKTNRYLIDEETDLAAPKNQLVASIPGLVVKLDGSRFAFRATDTNAAGTVDNLAGKVTLSLEKAGESSTASVPVAMPEYESVFELYPILHSTRDDATAGALTDATVFPVHNVEASLRRQIAERGGIAAAFVADYGPNPSTKNAEFGRQAEEMIATLPPFVVKDGEVRMGYRLWSSFTEIDDALTELRTAVQDLLDLNQPPRVATLAIYGHGLRTKLQVDKDGYDKPGSLRVDRVPDFVALAKPHLSDAPVIALFACNTGAGPQPNPDNRYGDPRPCEELGGDSLAWTLYRELVREGICSPTVWAHTTAAHTTRNPRLRVFSRFGTADFVNVLFQSPRLKDTTIKAFLDAVKPIDYSAAKAALYRERLHNANLIRRISLQHAMYLPWAWNGGEDADSSTEGYTDGARREARAVFDALRALAPGEPSTLPDDLVYADASRAVITGLREGVDNTRLSQNFSYSEIAPLADPMRIRVDVLKAMQLLRYRSRKGLTPSDLPGGGLGISVQVQPDTNAVRNAVLAKASGLVAEGLLTGASLNEGLILLTAPSREY